MLTFIRNIPDLMKAFKQGEEVANAATWKNRTIAGNAVVALLTTLAALAKGFGYDLSLDDQTLAQVGMGVVGVVTVINAILHVVTSARVGLPADGKGNTPAA